MRLSILHYPAHLHSRHRLAVKRNDLVLPTFLWLKAKRASEALSATLPQLNKDLNHERNEKHSRE